MLPLPLLGIPDGYDTPQHLRFVETYQRAMESGVLVPGWAADDNYGFGSVGIRFYPPLSHYLMTLAQMVTKDWYDTIWVTAFFWMIVGGIGMYLWAREYLTPPRSAVASLLFATMPYHLMELYIYMLLAEFAAIAILPFCFLFATRIIKGGKPGDVLLFGVSFAVLSLTHLPSIIIGSIGLGIYCLFLIDWSRFRQTALNFTIAFAISLSATAFFLVRLVTELPWVKHNDPQFYAANIYDYRQYLFPMILNPEKPFWKKMVLLVDIPIFLTFLFLLSPMLCFLLKAGRENSTKSQRKILAALSATGLFLIFILSYPSVFVWDSIILLQKVQFPFRFLSAASVIAALGITISLPALQARFVKMKKPIGYMAFTILFATSLFTITQIMIPSDPLSREKFRDKTESMQNESGCRCWWPVWADARAFSNSERVEAGTRNITISEWGGESRRFVVDEGQPDNIRVATFYYPYWKADINGAPVQPIPDENGALLIPVSNRKSDVHLYFQEPVFVDIAKYLSLFVWAGLAIALVLAFRRFRPVKIKLSSVA